MRRDSALTQDYVRSLCERTNGMRVVVVGDAMVDVYSYGTPQPSGEPPFAKIVIEKEEMGLGGAANVTRNMKTLGASVIFIGVVGEDALAKSLRQQLREQKISNDLIVDMDRPTTRKERIVYQGQTLTRIDRESCLPVGETIAGILCDDVRERMKGASVLLLSDYVKGVFTEGEGGTMQRIVRLARERGILTVAGAKHRPASFYRGVDAVTLNFKESQEMAGKDAHNASDPLSFAGKTILEATEAVVLCITRGKDGVALFEKGSQETHITGRPREVFDVTGAGDTFVAAFALFRAAGASWAEAATIANAAAGVVVGKRGTATLTQEELLEQLRSSK